MPETAQQTLDRFNQNPNAFGATSGGLRRRLEGVVQNESVEQLLRTRAEQQNFEGFMPDADAFDAALDAEIEGLMAGLPVSIEQFNADLASRGLFTGGEAPKYLYSNVIAPVTRAAATATAQAKLGFSQQRMQGAIATESAVSNRIRDWYNWRLAQEQLEIQRKQAEAQESNSFFGGIGDLAGTAARGYLAYQSFGASEVARQV